MGDSVTGRLSTVEQNRMSRLKIALALLVLPWDLAAQVGSEPVDGRPMPELMRLSTAVAEIRKSPFHAAKRSAGELEGSLYRMEQRSALGPDTDLLRYQEAAEDTVVSAGWVFGATTTIGLLAYVGTAYGFSESESWVPHFSIPVVAVGLAAWGAGADPGRAAIGSILGGAIGLPLVYTNSPVWVILGVLGHPAVTTLASKIHFRRRPR